MNKIFSVLVFLLWASYGFSSVSVQSQSIEPVSKDQFSVSSIGFSFIDLEEENDLLSSVDAQSTRVFGQVLNYPNPVSFKEQNTTIGYYLEKDTDITIQITDQVGNQIYKETFLSGTSGGSSSEYNRVEISSSDFGQELPYGAYFITVMADNKMLGQCVMGVRP